MSSELRRNVYTCSLEVQFADEDAPVPQGFGRLGNWSLGPAHTGFCHIILT